MNELDPKGFPKTIISEHHCGKRHKISTVLSDLASQENCDDFEYDVMNIAAEYIDELEQFILNIKEKIDKLGE
jgi:hypothetical protein